MSKRLSRSTVRSISEMNLTSMMDLTFLLLITFIITFPMLEQGIPVNLPRGKAATLDAQSGVRTVSIDAEGRIFLDNDIVAEEALEQQLAEAAASRPDLQVLVRGDRQIAYGRVVTVLQVIHRLGITRMALVTREGE
jgi:biopolymer transport protein TolR